MQECTSRMLPKINKVQTGTAFIGEGRCQAQGLGRSTTSGRPWDRLLARRQTSTRGAAQQEELAQQHWPRVEKIHWSLQPVHSNEACRTRGSTSRGQEPWEMHHQNRDAVANWISTIRAPTAYWRTRTGSEVLWRLWWSIYKERERQQKQLEDAETEQEYQELCRQRPPNPKQNGSQQDDKPKKKQKMQEVPRMTELHQQYGSPRRSYKRNTAAKW